MMQELSKSPIKNIHFADVRSGMFTMDSGRKYETQIPLADDETYVARGDKGKDKLTNQGKELARWHWDMLVKTVPEGQMSSDVIRGRVNEFMSGLQQEGQDNFSGLLKRSLEARVRHMAEQEEWAEVKASGSPWLEVAEALTTQKGATREAALNKTYKQLAEVKTKISAAFSQEDLVNKDLMMAMETRVASETMKLLQTKDEYRKQQLEATGGEIDAIVRLAVATDLNADRNLGDEDIYRLLAIELKSSEPYGKSEVEQPITAKSISKATDRKPKDMSTRWRDLTSGSLGVAAAAAAMSMVFVNPENGPDNTKASWPEEAKPAKTVVPPKKTATPTPSENRKQLPTATLTINSDVEATSVPEEEIVKHEFKIGEVDLSQPLKIEGPKGIKVDMTKYKKNGVWQGAVTLVDSAEKTSIAESYYGRLYDYPAAYWVYTTDKVDPNQEQKSYLVACHSGESKDGFEWPCDPLKSVKPEMIGTQWTINGEKFTLQESEVMKYQIWNDARQTFNTNEYANLGYPEGMMFFSQGKLGLKRHFTDQLILTFCDGKWIVSKEKDLKTGQPAYKGWDSRRVLLFTPEGAEEIVDASDKPTAVPRDNRRE